LPWPGRFRPCPARCSHGLWIDSFGCLPRPFFEGRRRPAFYRAVPPERFHPTPASVATREWRGRQGLGLSGSVRAGSDPKIGSLPVRLAGSPKTAALPVRLVAPKGTRIGRVALRPEGRRSRVRSHPEGSVLTPGEIPRESPAAGPFHPKVLGLQQIAPPTRSPPPEGGGPNRRATHSAVLSDVSVELPDAAPEGVTPRSEPLPTRRWSATRGSSQALQQAGVS
jgi:hypothetical protein